MKHKIIILISFWSFLFAFTAKANNSNYLIARHFYVEKPNSDSFHIYYRILDSIINVNYYDTSSTCISAVRFMERYTEIKAHPDGDYFGWHSFTKQDLIAWKNYYDLKKKKKH